MSCPCNALKPVCDCAVRYLRVSDINNEYARVAREKAMAVDEILETRCYYIGIPVMITLQPNQKGFFADTSSGWCNARWPDGKVWTHWRAQLRTSPHTST